MPPGRNEPPPPHPPKKGKTMSFFSRFILVYFSLSDSKLEKHNNVWQGCQPAVKKKDGIETIDSQRVELQHVFTDSQRR